MLACASMCACTLWRRQAWCALERCYLPDSEYRDKRLDRLCGLLDQLSSECHFVGQQIPEYMTSINQDAEEVVHLAVEIGRLKHISELCSPCSTSRYLYQNAWCAVALRPCDPLFSRALRAL